MLSLLLVFCSLACVINAPQALADRSHSDDAGMSGGFVQSYRDSTAAELQSATSRMDGDYVRVSGEVVGYAVKADKRHVWLNVQDESGAVISVFASKAAANGIDTFGSYSTTGDTVEILGIYNQACSRHAGELEIHATSIELVSAGSAVERSFDGMLSLVGVLMLLVSLILTICERLWRGKRYLRILGIKL